MLVLTVVLELGCEACASHDPAYTAQFQQALQQVLDMAHEDWLWSEAGRGLLSAA